jgi:hypothetical protein
MIELPDQAQHQVYRALGEAVAHVWSQLPPDIQHHLFEAAVKSQGEPMRPQIAVFLHEKHTRTSSALKARAMPEPDSLGG